MSKKHKAERFFLFSNTILFACALSTLGAAVYRHRHGIEKETLNDNRFLTTEWHLLQELKEQTDKMLREKDGEIALLRAKYHESRTQNISPSELLKLEAELRRAENERAEILAARLSARPPTFTPSASVARATGRESATARATTTPLSVLVAEDKAGDSVEKASPSTTEPVAGSNPQSRAGSGETIDVIAGALEKKIAEIDAEPPPQLESIRTRALLRALVSSPAIRAEYPDLLDALDRSFGDYGRQEWLKGQKAAYVFTIEELRKGLR